MVITSAAPLRLRLGRGRRISQDSFFSSANLMTSTSTFLATGSINTANGTGAATCVACPEGLRCPMGSSLKSLKTGDKDYGDAFRPRILEGYFSTEDCNFDVLELSVAVFLWTSGGQNGVFFREFVAAKRGVPANPHCLLN